MRSIRRDALHNRSGALLLEFAVAVAVYVVGVMSVFALAHTNSAGANASSEIDTARVAFEDVLELLKREDFRTLHQNYNGVEVLVSQLQGADGQDARIRIATFVNELAIPAGFGPVLDLDGRGGLDNDDCSMTYRMLPVHLRLEYETAYGTTTRQLYALIAHGS